jgi:hypothetical protein
MSGVRGWRIVRIAVAHLFGTPASILASPSVALPGWAKLSLTDRGSRRAVGLPAASRQRSSVPDAARSFDEHPATKVTSSEANVWVRCKCPRLEVKATNFAQMRCVRKSDRYGRRGYQSPDKQEGFPSRASHKSADGNQCRLRALRRPRLSFPKGAALIPCPGDMNPCRKTGTSLTSPMGRGRRGSAG